jgi:peptidoglycan/xylan/chitin deacetylase (PgdA/CDA1 family)
VGDYLKEVDDCQQLVNSRYFRPPYGQLRQSQYRALLKKGYKIVMWDVISYDYETITGEQCLTNVLRNTKPGSIILFHDNIKAEQNLMYALPLVLQHFQSLGYTFKRLDQN